MNKLHKELKKYHLELFDSISTNVIGNIFLKVFGSTESCLITVNQTVLKELRKKYTLIANQQTANMDSIVCIFMDSVNNYIYSIYTSPLLGDHIKGSYKKENSVCLQINTYINNKQKDLLTERDRLLEVYSENEEVSNINIILKNTYCLTTKAFPLKTPELSVTENYNDNIVDFEPVFIKTLENAKKGLLILHGIAGTGKTTFIKHVLAKIDRKVLFLPSNMIHSLTSPTFITFLLDYKGYILFFEDVQHLLKDRESNNSTNEAISNINTLTDGMLSDILKMTILTTSNLPIKDLDKSITRAGRCLLKQEFKKLNKTKAKKLCEKTGTKYIGADMTLAEIYYGNNLEKKKTKIGF